MRIPLCFPLFFCVICVPLARPNTERLTPNTCYLTCPSIAQTPPLHVEIAVIV
jgi:hypothetical protein